MEVPIGTKVKVPFEIDTRKGNILYKGTVTEKGKAEGAWTVRFDDGDVMDVPFDLLLALDGTELKSPFDFDSEDPTDKPLQKRKSDKTDKEKAQTKTPVGESTKAATTKVSKMVTKKSTAKNEYRESRGDDEPDDNIRRPKKSENCICPYLAHTTNPVHRPAPKATGVADAARDPAAADADGDSDSGSMELFPSARGGPAVAAPDGGASAAGRRRKAPSPDSTPTAPAPAPGIPLYGARGCRPAPRPRPHAARSCPLVSPSVGMPVRLPSPAPAPRRPAAPHRARGTY